MDYPTPTEYVSGRRLWLAMPSTVRPRAVGVEGGDPGLQPGVVSAVTRSVGGTGTVSIYSGGPTDTFAVRLEIIAGGALGTATFRTRLQATEAWSATQTTPASGLHELPESGMTLLLAGPFAAGETHDFSTTESAQQRHLRRAISLLEMDQHLRTRGGAPLIEFGEDLELLASRCIVWELLGLRGYDPKSPHDQLVMERARRSWEALREIREEMRQGGWAGQATTAGVAMSSEPAQGQGLW